MSRALRLAVVLLAGSSWARAESVVILVRHGEKVDESRDAALSTAGRARALALSAMLKDAGIEAVYSTDTIRTRETARPTADRISKPVEIYDGDELPVFAKALRERGGRVLIVGHSDTTPELVQHLGGDPGPPIASHEYDRMYVLTLSADGKASTLCLRFRSGVEK